MSTAVGIHTITLGLDVDPKEFEAFMTGHVLPKAAETPGSVNRGGQSAIKSQHLLKGCSNAEYLWVVKSSGVFATDQFATVFERMHDEVRQKLEEFGTKKSSSVFAVLDSFDAGPRDSLGRLLGEPRRGDFI